MVVAKATNSKSNKIRWECLCKCGVTRAVVGADLKNGKSKSCGCLTIEATANRVKSLVGESFGRLTVLKRVGSTKAGKAKWLCRCVCGGTTEKCTGDLKNGHVKSCGCIMTEKSNAYASENRKVRSSGKYRVWRSNVFKADDCACQRCGEREGKLIAHHINSFAKYKDLRFEVDNGATLCVTCHKEFHDTYGLFEFTYIDYFEWLL